MHLSHINLFHYEFDSVIALYVVHKEVQNIYTDISLLCMKPCLWDHIKAVLLKIRLKYSLLPSTNKSHIHCSSCPFETLF